MRPAPRPRSHAHSDSRHKHTRTVQYRREFMCYSQPWLSNQTGSTNFSRVLAYSRSRVLAYLFFHPEARPLFKYGEIAETRKRRGAFFQHASMIGGYLVPTRLPLLRTFHRAVFPLGGKHDPAARARARAMGEPCYYVWVNLKRTFLGV